MRKFFALIFMLIITSQAIFANGDLWDNFGDSNSYGQKPVSDKEFEQALESKKKKKKREKNIPKGQEFSQSNETEMMTNTQKEPSILLVPLNLKTQKNEIIPIGHYEVEGIKADGKVFLNFYQSHNLVAKIIAEETQDDFGEETINFVKLREHGTNHVEIIYGNIDFNAYSILERENE